MPLFGAHPRTHVANASPHTIFVKVDTNVIPSIIVELGGKYGGIKYTENVDKVLRAGYCTIQSGEMLVFEPPVGLFDGTWVKRATVYISVISQQNDQLITIHDNLTRKDNSSIIVTPDNNVRDTEMGYIWRDTNGIDYKHN